MCRYAAQSGSVEALNSLGELARDGAGMEQDVAVAAAYFAQAAQAGCVPAMLSLACLQLQVRGAWLLLTVR